MSNNKDKKELPLIRSIDEVGKLGFFRVESLDIRFSNGQERKFFRIAPKPNVGVVRVLVIDKDELVFIEEFSAGVCEYEIGTVRGGVKEGEDIIEAARRELSEEVQLCANKLTLLRSCYGSTGYQTSTRHFVVAEDVYPDPNPLEGDEPEALEIVRWPLARLDELFNHDKFRDSCNLLALYELKEYLRKTGRIQ